MPSTRRSTTPSSRRGPASSTTTPRRRSFRPSAAARRCPSAFRCAAITKAAPLPELTPPARALPDTLCERGPLALRAAKEAAVRGLSLPHDDGLRLEALLAGTLRGTEDAAEGPKAFAEKRKPSFKAR